MIVRIESLWRHFKRGFKWELVIKKNGKTKYNSYIDHYLLYAFGKYKESYNLHYKNCIEFFVFFDYLRKKVNKDWLEEVNKMQEKLKYFLIHHVQKVYLND